MSRRTDTVRARIMAHLQSWRGREETNGITSLDLTVGGMAIILNEKVNTIRETLAQMRRRGDYVQRFKKFVRLPDGRVIVRETHRYEERIVKPNRTGKRVCPRCFKPMVDGVCRCLQ